MVKDLIKNHWRINKIVLPQHTDHAGVMWHGCYLNFLEEARLNALSKVGINYSYLSNNGFEMPVVELQIKYLNSCNHGDEIILNSWILEFDGIKLPWKTTFQKMNGDLAAEAIVKLVLIEKIKSGFKVIRKRPPFIDQAIKDLQRGSI
tara:strand:+ start:102 stop:545 length:444 start_codon:yes stop_codon:yes gene_type:complete